MHSAHLTAELAHHHRLDLLAEARRDHALGRTRAATRPTPSTLRDGLRRVLATLTTRFTTA